jgi:ubiquinone biosynthesis protein
MTRQDLNRFGRVVAILTRYGFDDIVSRLNLKHSVPWRDKVFRREIRKIRDLSTPRRVRYALEELGPTYVKFGQVLSSRPDVLPDDVTRELSKLQDDVAPFPFRDVKAIIEGELGHPLAENFDEFEEKPVAAASLSQVHRARTKAGDEVAVKVQRPGLGAVIDADIRVLGRLAALAERHLPDIAIYEPVALVDDFARTIHKELDFVREGRNADTFRHFFERDETVHVPKVHWGLTTARVLTLEFIRGTKVSDYARLDALGLDRKAIARNGAQLILKEIFDVRKFHADPHPGNLFVLDGNVIAPVDFGMIGVLDQETVDQLSVLCSAFVDKDVESMTAVLLRACRAGDPEYTRAIRLDVADLFDRYYGVPLQQLNMRGIIVDVTGILRRYKLQFPQELAMVTKSLVMIESVGVGLYPGFNIVEIVEPFARKLMMRKSDPETTLREVTRTVDETAHLLRTLPSDLREILAKIRRNEMAVAFEHRGLENTNSVIDRSSNRLSFAMVIAALTIGSSLIYQTGAGPSVYGYPLPGLAGFLLASVLGLWLLIAIVRSGRL